MKKMKKIWKKVEKVQKYYIIKLLLKFLVENN